MNSKLQALIIGCLLVWVSGCSIMISTPRQAEIRVQGLNDQFRSEFITLDDLVEQNLEIPLANSYALMLDFQWLLGSDDELDSEANLPSRVESELAPWLMCTFRF
jgi:hypothetical protein